MLRLKIVGLVSGQPTEFDNKFVAQYDPSYRLPDGTYDGGILEVTDDPNQALVFRTMEDAIAKYRESYGSRADGFPNRPLTAFSVVIS